MTVIAALLYLTPLLLILTIYLRRTKKKDRRARERLSESVDTGMTEPPSLHPVFDEIACIGCEACVMACPEHSLGMVEGKPVLVAPANCIGHGACQGACPVEAIQLVFGTAKRGMDIPMVKPTFETNVPGIFIAGELGGMGLIRKGFEQGKQAMDHIRARRGAPDELDVLIVGGGPAGFSASLAAKEYGLRYVTVEQEDSLGGSIYHYPRHKIAMTAPMKLPIVGKVNMYEVSKEELLGFFTRVYQEQGLEFRFNERLEALTKVQGSYVAKTNKATYKAKNVLLAIGRRGTPRKLGVPGEEQAKVVYRLIDPEQYRGKRVLVVGGGDSAAEAAIALAEEPETRVTLSYRGEAFGRLKQKNRLRLQEAEAQGQLTILLRSTVTCIDEKTVTLQTHDVTNLDMDNDAVIVCAGGSLPTPFLKEIGIMVQTHYGTPVARSR